MSTLQQILDDLNAVPIAGDGSLTLTAADFPDVEVVEVFFANVVGENSLTIRQATITEAEDGLSITVRGQADYLGYSALATVLTFASLTEGGELVDISLDGAFTAATALTLPVVSWITLHELRVLTHLDGATDVVDLTYAGSVRLDDGSSTAEVPVEIGRTTDGAWQIGVGGDADVSLTLAQLIDLLAGQSLTAFFPDSLVDVLAGVAFDGLSCVFNIELGTIPYFSVGVSAVNGWAIAPGVLEIRPGVALSLILSDVDPAALSGQAIGQLTGTFLLGGMEVPAFVQATSGGLWSIGLEAGRSVMLPSLADLLELAGGAGFLATFPDGFTAIPAIVIDKLMITFDAGRAALLQLDFAVHTAAAWPVIEGYFAVDDIVLALEVTQIDQDGSQGVGLSLKSVFEIGPTLVQCSLVKPADSDTWTLNGSLPPDGSINLTDTARALLPGILVPENIPDFVFTELSLTVVLGASTSFSFAAGSSESWVITPSLAIRELHLDFTWNGGVSGTTRGTITLGGVDLVLAADLENTANGGWHFAANTGIGQSIPIGELFGALLDAFELDVTLPAPLAGLTVKDLAVSFETRSLDFAFHATVDLPIGTTTVETVVAFELEHASDGTYRLTLSGRIFVGDGQKRLEFDLVFSDSPEDDLFLAAFHNATGREVSVQSLVASLAPSLAGDIPAGLVFNLEDALFAWYRPNSGTSTFLFGLDMEGGVDLSNLPLIGQELPSGETIQLQYQVLFASAPFSADTLALLDSLVPAESTPLPTEAIPGAEIDLSTKILFGGDTYTLDLPVVIDSQTGQLEPTNQGGAPRLAARGGPREVDDGADGIQWIDLQKKFGPVYFEKVGGKVDGDELTFALSASLALAGLSVSLDGLSLTTPLTEFAPSFGLDGLAIAFVEGPVEIGGAFLRVDEHTYNGMALIALEVFQITALGSYSKLDGAPSLFLYGVLDAPLIGQPYLLLEGLAAGFGYNRRLVAPGIDEVADFPLVAAATSGVRGIDAAALDEMLRSLQTAVPPLVGQDFLALGVKVSSFKMVNAFALLTVQFGRFFELDVLGLATATFPTPVDPPTVPPLAELQLALVGRFVPDEGFLGLQGELTTASYLLAPPAQLTGGFAAFGWFLDVPEEGILAGDFVLTVGGYHPDFDVPAHYPMVPRLGFNWRVLSELTFKGEVYAALTPVALMAGGALEAVWEDGDLRAWFKADANFLVAWQPYYYTATVAVDVGASYTFSVLGVRKTVTFDVGAGLDLWGPPFSGRVRVDYTVVSFTVEFGAAAPDPPDPILWPVFEQTLLPASRVAISPQAGLLTKTGEDPAEIGVVSPSGLELAVDLVVPIKEVTVGGTARTVDAETGFGVAPVAIAPGAFSSALALTVTRDGSEPAEGDFVLEPILKNVPAALWGESSEVELGGESFVEGVLTGYTLRPVSAPPQVPETLDLAAILNAAVPLGSSWTWETPIPWVADDESDAERRAAIAATLSDPEVAAARAETLAALGLGDAVIDVDPGLALVFQAAPQIPTSESGLPAADEGVVRVAARPPDSDAWPWQDTGVPFSGGERLSFTWLRGEWTARIGRGFFTAAGDPVHAGGTGAFFPNAPESELLGAAADAGGTPAVMFRIGTGRTFYLPEGVSGRLLLGINDAFGPSFEQGAQDNAGSVDVRVGLEPGDFAGFAIEGTALVPAEAYRLTLEVLGAEIVMGSRGPMAVTVAVEVDGERFEPFGAFDDPERGNINPDVAPVPITRATLEPVFAAGTSIHILARAWFEGRVRGEADADDTDRLILLEALDDVPDTPGFRDQASIATFLSPYIIQGRLGVGANQAVFLFELGSQVTGATADFQDAVILLTIEPIGG